MYQNNPSLVNKKLACPSYENDETLAQEMWATHCNCERALFGHERKPGLVFDVLKYCQRVTNMMSAPNYVVEQLFT